MSTKISKSLFQLHLIAANEPFPGHMYGISGADYTCYKEAKNAGLSGTYRAFLTSDIQDLISIVHYQSDKDVPVVNIKVNTKL